jgi:hypothetical protein
MTVGCQLKLRLDMRLDMLFNVRPVEKVRSELCVVGDLRRWVAERGRYPLA